MRLQFGYNAGLPEDRTVAWGARWIVSKRETGYFVEQLWDRQDIIGEEPSRKKLSLYLNSRHIIAKAIDEAKRLFDAHHMMMGGREHVILFHDGMVTVLANPQASHGYLYVVAYWTNKELENGR